MADPSKRRQENSPGDFFVDSTCIDCATCRNLAPDSFRRSGAQSAVLSQPQSQPQIRAALRALLACPTASIGRKQKDALALREVQGDFPMQIEGDVYYCGYHSERSYGAASYLILAESGNILVDSPRFARPLVRQIEALGGIQTMFLTHSDDVADHEQFAAHFGCQRILHEADVSAGTVAVERKLHGTSAVSLGPELTAIPVPGHTRGHAVLLFRDFLFTGDHLAFSERAGCLRAFRNACWYSWDEQIRSMQTLREYDFRWVLPGHGGRHQAGLSQMHAQLAECIAWMKTVA